MRVVRYFDVTRRHSDEVQGLQILRIPGVEVIYPASERDGTLGKGFAIREGHSSLDRYGHVLYSAATRKEAVARCELAAIRSASDLRTGIAAMAWARRGERPKGKLVTAYCTPFLSH